MTHMEWRMLPSNRCKTPIDKAWFKVSLKKVMDMMMISWITSISNMNKKRKIREIAIRELMQLKWTSNNLLQSILMVLILIMRRRQTWRVMVTMRTEVQIWISIRKMRLLKACWINSIIKKNFRFQTLKNKFRNIMTVDQNWTKEVITKWQALLTLKRCFKEIYSLLTTIWKTEIAMPSSRDIQTSKDFVQPLENPCTVV